MGEGRVEGEERGETGDERAREREKRERGSK